MKILLNTTKTMDCESSTPLGLSLSRPRLQAETKLLATAIKTLDQDDLADVMDLSTKLAAVTRADLALWGRRGRPRGPALAVFTGLVYKALDAQTLDPVAWERSHDQLRILSGLYGLLRGLDRIEAYRLEMGCKFPPPGAANLTAFWKPRLTALLNRDLKRGEPVINLAAGEYTKALDLKQLKGPVITPVFKEQREDGTLKVVTVHAKVARGAMTRMILAEGLQDPADLLAFDHEGWEASREAPSSGEWLFTR